MLDMIANYILPNIVLFGSLYALGVLCEKLAWDFIVWFSENS